jgi:Xaa-Pro aminopeptidase
MVHRSDPAKMEVGMVVSLHPTARPAYGMMVSDTYVITEAGAVPIYENLFNDDEIAVVG